MSIQYKNCKNCVNDFKSNFDFCPHCGMKEKEELTLGVLFYNTLNNYLLYDSKFFKSIIPLMSKPGFLPNKFIEGKRLSFLHPAQMYLFVTFVFFFLFSIVSNKQVEKLNNEFKENTTKVVNEVKKMELDSVSSAEIQKAFGNKKSLTGVSNNDLDSIIGNTSFADNSKLSFDFNKKIIDSLLTISAPKESIYRAMGMDDDSGWIARIWYAQILKFYKQKDIGSLFKSMLDATPIALFILLPIFALLLKLFYWKKGRYAYHLVFTFYFFAFLFIVFNTLLITDFIVDVPGWIDFLVLLSTFIYLFFAIKYFYKQGWFLSLLKSGIITFIFLAMVLPFAFVALGIISFMFY